MSRPVESGPHSGVCSQSNLGFDIYGLQKEEQYHRIGGNRKRSYQSKNADQNSLETEFLIAICHQSGNKWQSKILFLTIFYLRQWIVLTFLIAAYPV